MISSYIICATPRSGSNLLCELLCSLGFAGYPQEHLWDPPGTEPEPLADRWPRLLASGTDGNGVFGTKLMWYQVERLERELPGLLGTPGQCLARVLADVLANPKYVYLTRRDHVRQAISLARAIQTGQWRSSDGIRGTLQYDRNAIERGLDFLRQDEANWEAFFARNRLSPYRLRYESLDSEPEATVTALLRHLGHRFERTVSLPPAQLRRQADTVSDEWLRCYHEDLEAP